MKKYVLILLMIVSPLIGQENKAQQMNFPYVNNSLKLYTALGLPTGIGLVYAPEIRSSINNNVLNVLNFDLQWIGVDVAADIASHQLNHLLAVGFGFSFQYSVGTLLANGARFYVDLLGVGIQFGIVEGGMILSINSLGIQSTFSNGFYVAVRTKLNLSRNMRHNTISVGYGGYVAIGYDFGKLINPKDYEPRMK